MSHQPLPITKNIFQKRPINSSLSPIPLSKQKSPALCVREDTGIFIFTHKRRSS
jgi:hypothetical protein